MQFVHADDRGESFLRRAEPEQLRTVIAERLPGDDIGLDSILSDVGDRILRYSIPQSYPGYLAFPDTGITSLHLVGCADTEQPQAQCEHARCQRAQREAAGADIVLGAKHRTSLIKGH